MGELVADAANGQLNHGRTGALARHHSTARLRPPASACLTMAECGGTLQYTGGQLLTCTRPAGHKGPHFDAGAPASWTCSIAVIPPRKW